MRYIMSIIKGRSGSSIFKERCGGRYIFDFILKSDFQPNLIESSEKKMRLPINMQRWAGCVMTYFKNIGDMEIRYFRRSIDSNKEG